MEVFPCWNLCQNELIWNISAVFQEPPDKTSEGFQYATPPPRSDCSPASRHGSSLSKYSGAISCSNDWNKFTYGRRDTSTKDWKKEHSGVRDLLAQSFLALRILTLLTRGLHLKTNIKDMKELKSGTFTGGILTSYLVVEPSGLGRPWDPQGQGVFCLMNKHSWQLLPGSHRD